MDDKRISSIFSKRWKSNTLGRYWHTYCLKGQNLLLSSNLAAEVTLIASGFTKGQTFKSVHCLNPSHPLSLFAEGLTYTDINKNNLLDHNSQLLEYYVWVGSETVHFLSPPHPTLSFRFMRRGSITITHLFPGTAETWNCRWNVSERVRCSLSWRLSEGLKLGEFQVYWWRCVWCLHGIYPHWVLIQSRCFSTFVVVQWQNHVRLFATLWTAACQASLSFPISWI